MQHGKKVAIALGRIGATRQMSARISSTHIEAQHRKTLGSKGYTKPAHTFATTGSTKTMEYDHHCLWLWRAIKESEQRTRASGTAL
jgi:hypothetical protein